MLFCHPKEPEFITVRDILRTFNLNWLHFSLCKAFLGRVKTDNQQQQDVSPTAFTFLQRDSDLNKINMFPRALLIEKSSAVALFKTSIYI